MKKFIWFINSTIFLLILLVGGFAFWIHPKQDISNDENRKLMSFPLANSTTIFSGKFEKDFEEYYNDHFPLRDKWLELANFVNTLKGIQDQEVRVINLAGNQEDSSNIESEESGFEENEHQNGTDFSDISLANENNILSEPEEQSSQLLNQSNLPKENESIVTTDKNVSSDNGENSVADESTDSLLPQNEDSQKDEKQQELNNAEFSKVKGLVIVNNRVLQVFAGTKHSINPYIKMMNTYRAKLPKDVKMYTMITPSGSDFYLPNKVTKGISREKENIEHFEKLLSEKIISIPAYDTLARHKDEYIYFKTDHHWTGLGAYYAYTAFAKEAGFEPIALDKMEFLRKDKSFLGSLYNYTKDKQLKDHPDILEYYKIPVKSDVTVYMDNKKNFKGELYSEKNNSYLLFIGGDFPLTHIHTPTNNVRKILIIKDSFGNAFVPYLASHYSDIYVVDYRYFKSNVLTLIQKYGIKELLYMHNTFAANSNASTKFGLGLLNKRNVNVKKN